MRNDRDLGKGEVVPDATSRLLETGGAEHHYHSVAPHIDPDGTLAHHEPSDMDHMKDLGFVSHAPKHLRTTKKRWIALVVVCCACALSSGPVGAWPTLEPLFIKCGLFKGPNQSESLNAVYSLATACQLGGSLPAGFLYDRIGGQKCSLYGGLFTGLGLLIMSMACFYPEQLSWAMFVGYPLSQFAGQINTYGVFVFIWLLPSHQNLVASTAGGVQSLSDLLALLAVAVSGCCGLFIGSFLFILSILSCISGVVCFYQVPDQQTMMEFAAVSLGDEAAENMGITNQSNDGDGKCCAGELESVKRSWELMKQYRVANGLLLAFSTAYCLSILGPVQQMLFYYEALFGKGSKQSVELVNAWAVLYGTGGFVCAILGGTMCDRLGLKAFTLVVAACSALVAAFLPVADFGAQVLVQVVLTIGLSLYTIIVNRFAMLYAPPDLFGTLGGVQFTIISVGLFVGMQAMTSGVPTDGTATAEQFQIPFVSMGFVSFLLGLALAYYWHSTPPPTVEEAAMMGSNRSVAGGSKREME
mmetsp:Transcript_32345/g.81495  ORF Transcript_32345/g.81495 Transcript_32345/m.81495 type:complete len:528 (+) Transcript_32345:116-1699(+)